MFALLAFPTHAMAVFFLRGPLHIGTTLWALIAFACLRKGRFGWGWVIAVVFLAAGALGDLQILVLGIAPIFLAGLVAMLRTRTWRGGIAQVTAAAAGVALFEIVRSIAKGLGAYSIGTANPTYLHLILPNLRHAASSEPSSPASGARSSALAGFPHALQDVHIVGGIVWLPRSSRRWSCSCGMHSSAGSEMPVRRPAAPQLYGASDASSAPLLWRLDDMLVIGIIGVPIDYGALALAPRDIEYARYLAPALIFAAILAGRMVAAPWRACRARSTVRHAAMSHPAAAMRQGRRPRRAGGSPLLRRRSRL